MFLYQIAARSKSGTELLKRGADKAPNNKGTKGVFNLILKMNHEEGTKKNDANLYGRYLNFTGVTEPQRMNSLSSLKVRKSFSKDEIVLIPFRELKQSFTPAENGKDRKSYWSGNTVQREINKVLNSRVFKFSPHSAYLAVYQRMTAARDLARCTPGNPMCPKSILDQRLNDAMSDMMTRNYLQIVNTCVSEPHKAISTGLDVGSVFARMHRKAEKENWDSVRVAMGSTALYLSSHLALAVSALPHIDHLWTGTPYTDINSRVNRLKEFKPIFDAFNPFLAKNLVTVAKSLKDAKLTGNSLLENTAKFAEPLLPWEKLFGVMRDNAFASGINIAMHTPRGEHPWVVKDKKGKTGMLNNVVDALPFPNNKELQRDLYKLESQAWTASVYLANPLTKIFDGKTFLISELKKDSKQRERELLR